MGHIELEMEALAKSMVKTQDLSIAELITELGKDGLKKAASEMTEEQLVAFREELKKHIPGVSDSKYDSCVEDVKAKEGDKVNAYAVCRASLEKGEAMEE